MLETYRGVVPEEALNEVYDLAAALKGRNLQHINSTGSGGGVAEILHRLVPLTESLGISTRWDIIDISHPNVRVWRFLQ
jgi:trehalose synthase